MQTELIETGVLQRSLEALLFVASEALPIEALAKHTGATPVEVAQTLAQIADAFAERGIVLREIAGGYRFATSPAARAAVEAYLMPAKTTLSPAAMETLAIVAYLQPATRAEIEAVRGVNVDGVVGTLVDRNFIVEAGRREVVGRPAEYKTTPEFLEAFGLRSLAELPPVDVESGALELAFPVTTEPAAMSASEQNDQAGLAAHDETTGALASDERARADESSNADEAAAPDAPTDLPATRDVAATQLAADTVAEHPTDEVSPSHAKP